MAAPTEHESRKYQAFLRGPADTKTFAYTTVNASDAYRSGVHHAPLMAVFPEPVDNEADEFGIMQGGGFTVEIADEDLGNWYVLQEDGSRILLEDGSGSIIKEF